MIRRPLLALLALVMACAYPMRAQGNSQTPKTEDTAPPDTTVTVSDPLTNTVTLTTTSGGRKLGFGLSQLPQSMWCGSSGLTGTIKGIAPQYLAAQLRAAASCGFELTIVIPRPLLTQNGQMVGLWSTDNCKHAIDLYANAVSPASWASYVAAGTIMGLNVGDDYGSAPSWGGKQVTQAQVAGCTIYAKQRLGAAVPIGVRVPAFWVARYSGWQHSLDYVWNQYRKAFGDPKVWFSKMASDAQALGLKSAGGVNVTDCVYAGTNDACSASQLLLTVAIPIADSRYCVVQSWMYDWAYSEKTRHAAWVTLTAQANAQGARSCHV